MQSRIEVEDANIAVKQLEEISASVASLEIAQQDTLASLHKELKHLSSKHEEITVKKSNVNQLEVLI